MENQSTAKRPDRGTRWIWAAFVVWCLIFGVIVFATADKLGTVPESILLPLGLANILVVIGVVILLRRAAVRRIRVEKPDEKTIRLHRARRGLRNGAILYGFILLWDVYLIAKGNLSVVAMVVGVSINVLVLYAIIATSRKVRRSLVADNRPQQQ